MDLFFGYYPVITMDNLSFHPMNGNRSNTRNLDVNWNAPANLDLSLIHLQFQFIEYPKQRACHTFFLGWPQSHFKRNPPLSRSYRRRFETDPKSRHDGRGGVPL